MPRDHFKEKLAAEPRMAGGFRSVVGTAERNKLKETAAAV